jgi:hypothetical protein
MNGRTGVRAGGQTGGGGGVCVHAFWPWALGKEMALWPAMVHTHARAKVGHSTRTHLNTTEGVILTLQMVTREWSSFPQAFSDKPSASATLSRKDASVASHAGRRWEGVDNATRAAAARGAGLSSGSSSAVNTWSPGGRGGVPVGGWVVERGGGGRTGAEGGACVGWGGVRAHESRLNLLNGLHNTTPAHGNCSPLQ